jgi:hypothetical protein
VDQEAEISVVFREASTVVHNYKRPQNLAHGPLAPALYGSSDVIPIADVRGDV